MRGRAVVMSVDGQEIEAKEVTTGCPRAPWYQRSYVLSFIYYPATCGPKGHGSGGVAAEATAVGFYTSVFPWPQTEPVISRTPVSPSP